MKSIILLLGIAISLALGCASRRPPSHSIFTFRVFDGELQFTLDLPSSYTAEHHRGPDFDVYYFSDPSNNRQIGIYFGCCPALQIETAKIAGVQHVPAQFGNSTIEWLRWLQNKQHHSETLVPGLTPNVIAHVFITAETEQAATSLEKTASTLTLIPSR